MGSRASKPHDSPRRSVNAELSRAEADLPIYNIPVDLIEAYRGRRIIVRMYDPAQLVEKLTAADLENLCFVQLLTLAADVGVLTTWESGVPVDIIMHEPDAEFAKLYNHAQLLQKHPVRITIPVRQGFLKAVKIANSLGFAVKLCVSQPDAKEVSQLFEALDLFLHQPAFSEPIEFFQSSMQFFFLNDATNMWEIQEEDPAVYRFVSAEGKEFAPPRSVGSVPFTGRNPDTSVEDLLLLLMSEGRECRNCEYLSHCRGYFKWPNKDYLCSGGVKELFRELKSAAGELKDDLAIYSAHKRAHHP